MNSLPIIVTICCFAGCSATPPKTPLAIKNELSKELKEISGISASGTNIWAITDKPHAEVYKLDLSGNLVQTISVTNAKAVDVEAVTSDASNVYIGDLGDNNGDRAERTIIKIATANVKSGAKVDVTGEEIIFTFPGEGAVEKKKQNNFDCESLLSYKDSLYVFTKDRQDKETRLYVLPKTPGKYVARFIDNFNSDGLVTDVAINPAGNEVAMIGYHKGHKYPFIILLNGFIGNDFFSGKQQRINLANKSWDWQLEGITYGSNNMLYFSCEGTDEVQATLYGIKRENIFKLDKKKDSDKKDKEEKSGISTKGHLKY